jgi:transcriptional regulator with XRE-family HTH domain
MPIHKKIRRKHRAITNFGKNMQRLRIMRGKTQKELVTSTLSLHAISDIENNYRDPRPEEAEIIADALGISVEYLYEPTQNNIGNHFKENYTNKDITNTFEETTYERIIEIILQDKENIIQREEQRSEYFRAKYEEILKEVAALKAELAILKEGKVR